MSVNTGQVQLNGSASGYTRLQAAAAVTDYTLTWPATVGSAGQALTTDGVGTLAWAAAGGFSNPIETITASSFDLSLSPFWKLDQAITVPNPTNGVDSMSGLIYFNATPIAWSSNFQFVGGSQIAPQANSIAPFFVTGPNTIYIGAPQGPFS